MKRLIIVAFIVIIALAGIAGGVYAGQGQGQGHGHGQQHGGKLVGFGCVGSTPGEGERTYFHSYLAFTNPDPVVPIQITKVVVAGWDGSVIYEGPFLGRDGEWNRIVVTEPMQPREMRAIRVYEYMYLGGDITDPASWMTDQEALSSAVTGLTVEIHWEPVSPSATCQLIGWEHLVLAYSPGLLPDYPAHFFGDARTSCPLINVDLSSGQ